MTSSARGAAAEAPEPPRKRGASRVPSAASSEREAADGRRPVRVARFVNAALVVLCLVGSVQVAALIVVEGRRLWHAEREIARLEREIGAIESESRDLLEVAGRADDAAYREQLARRQGYVHPYETRFVGPRPAP